MMSNVFFLLLFTCFSFGWVSLESDYSFYIPCKFCTRKNLYCYEQISSGALSYRLSENMQDRKGILGSQYILISTKFTRIEIMAKVVVGNFPILTLVSPSGEEFPLIDTTGIYSEYSDAQGANELNALQEKNNYHLFTTEIRGCSLKYYFNDRLIRSSHASLACLSATNEISIPVNNFWEIFVECCRSDTETSQIAIEYANIKYDEKHRHLNSITNGDVSTPKIASKKSNSPTVSPVTVGGSRPPMSRSARNNLYIYSIFFALFPQCPRLEDKNRPGNRPILQRPHRFPVPSLLLFQASR